MTMDEKFKQVEDWLSKSDTEPLGETEQTDWLEPYDQNEAIRLETIRLQLGIRKPVDYGCVTVMTSDGEFVDDYDLCAYLD